MAKLFSLLVTVLASALGVLAHPFNLNPKVDPTLNWRIVGGSNAADGQFPYQISLRSSSSGSHNCGGSILDGNTILTAPHCVDGATPSRLYVVAGSNQLNSGGTRLNVSSIRSHEEYNSFTVQNDIAILKLASTTEFSDKVQPIELETSDVGADVDAVLGGWGRTGYPGSTPNDLQFINQKTISVSECRKRLSVFPPVRDSQVCTLTQRGEGACHGDSGGPLVANGKQIGIVSWGRPCAIGYPDVFTRVSSFREWIEENRN